MDNSNQEKQDFGQESRTSLDSKFKATEIKGSRMIENVTRFLNQATEQRNRKAEEQMKWEQIKNSPGPGYQRRQQIPAHVTFCYLCLAYKEKIHYCTNLKKYVNLDDKNLIMIEGDTAKNAY